MKERKKKDVGLVWLPKGGTHKKLPSKWLEGFQASCNPSYVEHCQCQLCSCSRLQQCFISYCNVRVEHLALTRLSLKEVSHKCHCNNNKTSTHTKVVQCKEHYTHFNATCTVQLCANKIGFSSYTISYACHFPVIPHLVHISEADVENSFLRRQKEGTVDLR